MTVPHELKAMGVGFSIDDFGTGYSSLNYLKRLPVNTLKMDQSFVRDLTVDSTDAAIATAVIGLGHGLNLSVLAEGVETQGQVDYLRALKCDQVQGYVVSEPLPPETFSQLLEKTNRFGDDTLFHH
jgi:EAL domain-containing protein (putative c-di-GMP-specific phosphodiesterase class I)